MVPWMCRQAPWNDLLSHEDGAERQHNNINKMKTKETISNNASETV